MPRDRRLPTCAACAGVLARSGAVLAAALAALALLAAAPPAGARDVSLRGTAYEFNNSPVRLAGATIRVAELPRLRATVRRDGTYVLRVPDRARITPYIVAPGHHTIHLQTFRTAGEDLERVNFQTPTEEVYRALAALLGAPLDANGELTECAIVSTFSTRNVRDVTFEAFRRYGAHGVAGATAFATPPLPPPIYFNERVLPDPAQERSSVDGGVIWTRVPDGVYRIRARHPGTRFAGFDATCRAGRVVNANPPWGLHELGLPMPAAVSARWSAAPALQRLRVTRLPRGATVTVRCAGPRCPLRARAFRRARGGALDVRAALGSAAGRLRAGQVIEVAVGAPAHDGKVVRWRLRSGRAPRAETRCVPLGASRPRPRC